ncbi:hypothetical protein PMAYCL1PPCAC_03433, partial [Pristionchus mayeri]
AHVDATAALVYAVVKEEEARMAEEERMAQLFIARAMEAIAKEAAEKAKSAAAPTGMMADGESGMINVVDPPTAAAAAVEPAAPVTPNVPITAPAGQEDELMDVIVLDETDAAPAAAEQAAPIDSAPAASSRSEEEDNEVIVLKVVPGRPTPATAATPPTAPLHPSIRPRRERRVAERTLFEMMDQHEDALGGWAASCGALGFAIFNRFLGSVLPAVPHFLGQPPALVNEILEASGVGRDIAAAARTWAADIAPAFPIQHRSSTSNTRRSRVDSYASEQQNAAAMRAPRAQARARPSANHTRRADSRAVEVQRQPAAAATAARRAATTQASSVSQSVEVIQLDDEPEKPADPPAPNQVPVAQAPTAGVQSNDNVMVAEQPDAVPAAAAAAAPAAPVRRKGKRTILERTIIYKDGGEMEPTVEMIDAPIAMRTRRRTRDAEEEKKKAQPPSKKTKKEARRTTTAAGDPVRNFWNEAVANVDKTKIVNFELPDDFLREGKTKKKEDTMVEKSAKAQKRGAALKQRQVAKAHTIDEDQPSTSKVCYTGRSISKK